LPPLEALQHALRDLLKLPSPVCRCKQQQKLNKENRKNKLLIEKRKRHVLEPSRFVKIRKLLKKIVISCESAISLLIEEERKNGRNNSGSQSF
jgi:hypothetical protein